MVGASHGKPLVLLEEIDARNPRAEHERVGLRYFGRRLAALLGYEFQGKGGLQHGGYYLPADTLDAGQAAAHGIRGPEDLFGGVVPHAFVATKLISHGLWPGGHGAPQGWNHDLGQALGDAVLPGWSVFTRADLRAAAQALLDEGGAVRCKLAWGRGGNDQTVAGDAVALREWSDTLDDADLARGVVVEADLEPADTFSIGCVDVPGQCIAYFGTQRSTRNARGHRVYGGSQLRVARGTLEQLLTLALPEGAAEAIDKVCRYEAGIARAYPDFYASRRNYDAVRGRDGQGRLRCGVLEQSWRYGGASPAEILALEAFAADPALHWLDALTHESYDEDEAIPAGAVVYYRGDVGSPGVLSKYAMVRTHGRQP